MVRVLVAIALIAACRGEKRSLPKDAGRDGPTSRISVVPSLPRSDDGAEALRGLDRRIDALAKNRALLVPALLERARLRGRVEDYQRALVESEALVKEHPGDADALLLRIGVLTAVHRFADARAVIAKLEPLVDRSRLVEARIAVDDATASGALPARADLATRAPTAGNLTLYALGLATEGQFDAALALVPKAAAAAQRINTPEGTGWLLFQWGRIYELEGEPAAARELYEASHARMPAVDTIEHLAATLIATGDREQATALVGKSLADFPHPALRALAIELGAADDLGAVTAEWERYATALPEAFSDHAARFYLGVGRRPARALALAQQNLTYRDTRAGRALVIDAAVAAGDGAAACAVVEPLITAGTRAERFAAWKALRLCGRTGEADRLANDLGIRAP